MFYIPTRIHAIFFYFTDGHFLFVLRDTEQTVIAEKVLQARFLSLFC